MLNNPRFRRVRPLLLVCIGYLYVELLCAACLFGLNRFAHLGYNPGLSRLEPDQKELLAKLLDRVSRGIPAFVGLDSELGWVVSKADANSAGMRGNREYASDPPPEGLRIAAYGDSYTFGDEVTNEENWTSRVSAMRPSIEVLNYGVRAYGLDQGYLRYRRTGAAFHPDIVLIGYMSENLARDVNVFRPFYMNAYKQWVVAKPRFKLAGDGLRLVPNPLPNLDAYRRLLTDDRQVMKQMGRNDYYYQVSYSKGPLDFSPAMRLAKVTWRQIAVRVSQPVFLRNGSYNVRSEAYRVTTRIFDDFSRQVLANGALPVILIFPTRDDNAKIRAGVPPRYAPLMEYFRSRGYRYIDLQNAFDRTTPVDAMYTPGVHFNPATNQKAAAYIVSTLDKWGLTGRANVLRAAAAEKSRLSEVPAQQTSAASFSPILHDPATR